VRSWIVDRLHGRGSRQLRDTFGVVIPEVKTRLGQAKAGPEVAYRYQLSPDLVLEPGPGCR